MSDILGQTQPLLKYSSSCQCTLASSDGNILYYHLLGGVIPGNSLILCLIHALVVLIAIQIHQQTQCINNPNGESRHPQNSPPERVPHAPMASGDSTRRINVNQATVPQPTSLQIESKEESSMCATEFQGKPAKRQCPPGTFSDKLQAYQSIWG